MSPEAGTLLVVSSVPPSGWSGLLTRIMREQTSTFTPALSLAEGEGAVSIPSPPEGERDRVRGGYDAEHAFVNNVR